MLNSAYQTVSNIVLTSKPLNILINSLVILKLFDILNNNNKYKYIYAIILTLVLVLILLFNEIQVFYFFFIIITELTSIYLVLLITINYTILTNHKKKYIFIILIPFLLYKTHNCYYWYFNLIPIVANQQPLLINFTYFQTSTFFYLTILFIIILTLIIINLLSINNKVTNKINILLLLKSIVNLINQIPTNVNLFINNILYK